MYYGIKPTEKLHGKQLKKWYRFLDTVVFPDAPHATLPTTWFKRPRCYVTADQLHTFLSVISPNKKREQPDDARLQD